MELEVQWHGARSARVGTLYQDRSGMEFFEYKNTTTRAAISSGLRKNTI